MTTLYDLYAIEAADLHEARRIVEAVLDVALAAHESGYHGGEYFRIGDLGGEHFILKRNFDPFEGEWAEPNHQMATFLLYVNESSRSEEIRRLLNATAAGVHLRTDRFD